MDDAGAVPCRRQLSTEKNSSIAGADRLLRRLVDFFVVQDVSGF